MAGPFFEYRMPLCLAKRVRSETSVDVFYSRMTLMVFLGYTAVLGFRYPRKL